MSVGFRRTDNYFAALFSGNIRKNIRRVGLVAQSLVEDARLLGADKDERDIPAGQYFLSYFFKRQTRHTRSVTGAVVYNDARHS